MVVVDADHPDIETYIDWKVKEEQKVAALVTGSKINQKHLKAVLKACVNCEGSGDDCFDPEKNPALRREIKLARRALVSDNVHQARDPVRQAGLQGHRLPDLRHRLGFRSLPHGLRPELQQLGLAEGRLFARGGNRRRLESDRPHQQEGDQDPQGPRPLGKDRPRRLGLGRSRPALQHHHERLAHLQIVRRHPRVEPVLGIHVPRRHRVQPGLRESDHVLFDDHKTLRRRILRASLSAVDHRAGNLRHDGAVPVARDRRTLLRVPHARPRLCEHRRPADDHGPALRQQGRPLAVRRAHRDHDRRRLCDLGRDGQRARPLPRLQEERRAHAARDPQPSPRGACRKPRL